MWGVVPAAGRAQRLQPLRGSKELVPVGGRPVMDFLHDALRAARCGGIRVVTRPDKDDVVDHAGRLGCEVVLGEPPDVAASLALGLGGLGRDDVVLFGFPDTIWEPYDGFTRLLARLDDDARCDVVLGLFELEDVRAADEVRCDAVGGVLSVVPKPADPVGNTTWGCLAARVGVLDGLSGVTEPGALVATLARARPGSVVGVLLGPGFVDVGTPAGLARARAEHPNSPEPEGAPLMAALSADNQPAVEQ